MTVSRVRGPRLFVGIREIGDYTLRLSQGLRAHGCEVTNVVIAPRSPLLERAESHDRHIVLSKTRLRRSLQLAVEFVRYVRGHDVFVFNYGRSFTSHLARSRGKLLHRLAYADLAVLKALGKKSVVVFLGSDLRSRRMLFEEMEEAGLDAHAKYARIEVGPNYGGPDWLKRRRAARIERYATHIFAQPNYAQLLTREYHFVWLPVNLTTFGFSINQTRCPLVIHAPSNPTLKGTAHVLDAVRRLEEEGYELRFELCQGMKNERVRELLSAADIVVDQLITPAYGLFAVEAMASGCAVLGSAVPGYSGFPTELPIMTTTPDTLYRNLKLLLGDQKLRMDMAHAGRAYVEEYHDHVSVAKRFLRDIGEGDR
jgi:glycosyltransferase involved in cell wall biosynthesis